MELDKGSDTAGDQIMYNHYASVSMENTPEIESGPLRGDTPLSFKPAREHKVVNFAKK